MARKILGNRVTSFITGAAIALTGVAVTTGAGFASSLATGAHVNFPIEIETEASIDPKEKECLAMALYHEARGEPVAGQEAVGRVIMNRVDSKYHPDTVCDVVYKNAHMKNRCQFSFACDGISDRPKETKAWSKKLALAEEILSCDEECRDDMREDGGIEASTHYHATYVNPSWARKLERKGKVGNHIFYYTATI